MCFSSRLILLSHAFMCVNHFQLISELYVWCKALVTLMSLHMNVQLSWHLKLKRLSFPNETVTFYSCCLHFSNLILQCLGMGSLLFKFWAAYLFHLLLCTFQSLNGSIHSL